MSLEIFMGELPTGRKSLAPINGLFIWVSGNNGVVSITQELANRLNIKDGDNIIFKPAQTKDENGNIVTKKDATGKPVMYIFKGTERIPQLDENGVQAVNDIKVALWEDKGIGYLVREGKQEGVLVASSSGVSQLLATEGKKTVFSLESLGEHSLILGEKEDGTKVEGVREVFETTFHKEEDLIVRKKTNETTTGTTEVEEVDVEDVLFEEEDI